jgi:competence protein ComEC
LGIVYLKPIFDEWLNKILPQRLKDWIEKKELRKQVRSIVTMTFAAQVGTLPILVYNFGRISFISPLANVLIVPALPYIMGAGFIFSLGSVLWLGLGKILVWPVWFMFAYITKLVELLSKIPFAAKEISDVHWGWLIGYYILLIGFLWWYKKKKAHSISTWA